MYLFDTNIIIKLLNNQKEIVFFCRDVEELHITSVTVGEMLYGAENSSKKIVNIKQYTDFFSACTIHNIDVSIAKEYAVLRKILKDKGKPIPENDIWIAAVARHYDLMLLTTDNHFSNLKEEIKIHFFDK